MTNIDRIKKDLLKAIDNIEIDVDSLESYEYHEHTSYEPSCDEWDSSEEFQKKLEIVIDRLNNFDTLAEFIDVTDEENEDDELKDQIIAWLESLQD